MRDGPAWIGIGAQRSGTTWFTDLRLQHPDVALNAAREKELPYFDRFVRQPFTADEAATYRQLFANHADARPGEFTPLYLRAAWIPPLVRKAAPDVQVLFVILRDPVERYHSAWRWFEKSEGDGVVGSPSSSPVLPVQGHGRHVGGFYAAQLAAWRTVFPAEVFHVVTYDRLRADPQARFDRAWERLGLSSHRLVDVTRRSPTSTTNVGARRPVEEKPRPDARRALPGDTQRLAREWDLDLSAWQSST